MCLQATQQNVLHIFDRLLPTILITHMVRGNSLLVSSPFNSSNCCIMQGLSLKMALTSKFFLKKKLNSLDISLTRYCAGHRASTAGLYEEKRVDERSGSSEAYQNYHPQQFSPNSSHHNLQSASVELTFSFNNLFTFRLWTRASGGCNKKRTRRSYQE